MAVVIDKIQKKPFLHEHPISVVSSDPANGKDGQMILNETSDTVKIWYANAWHTLHTLSLDGDQFIFENGDAYIFEDGDAYIFQA